MSIEYAVLNKPGFKVIKGSGDSWRRIHNDERATTPYVNPHRWWLGIEEYEVAEYISLKSKIDYWTPRQRKRDFDAEKFAQYNVSFNSLLLKFDEAEIMVKLSQYEWAGDILPKSVSDMFIF
jgi:hypothetical protein